MRGYRTLERSGGSKEGTQILGKEIENRLKGKRVCVYAIVWFGARQSIVQAVPVLHHNKQMPHAGPSPCKQLVQILVRHARRTL